MSSQSPITASMDLRDMLRQYLISRSLGCMKKAAERRHGALASGKIDEYCKEIRSAVRGFYGELPVGKNGAPLKSKMVSSFEKEGYRIENVLFDSFPGWEVNASVYVPLDYGPPFPAVVVPVGHSGKQFGSYQLPCQFFARSGYLAIVFDPPGQEGEKQPGNDHFIDGVRCYLTGETSSKYFVADALRCIDYLGTRTDVDMSYGVAMTGVSGGGTTTILANLLDDRISVIGPSCCLTALSDLDITQCYSGCPETHMRARYDDGIDEVDLLCAAAPKPILLMAGGKDTVFRIDDTRSLAGQVKGFYEITGDGGRGKFKFFIDKAGHCYSLKQARAFVRFMNKHLLGKSERTMCDLPDGAFTMNPDGQLRCYPRTDVNMRSLTLDTAVKLKKSRLSNLANQEKITKAAAKIAGNGIAGKVPETQEGGFFRIWTHQWKQILLKPEEGIELPGTMLIADNTPAPSILHFDDTHRNRLLQRNGILAGSINFINDSVVSRNLLSVDLRGYGDTEPALYPYEVAGWGSVDRYLAYTGAALGDSLMAMRIRDGLSSLAYLRSRPEVDNENIIITGCGQAAIAALHVSLIDGNVKGIVIWDSLVSFKALLETEKYCWGADTFVPDILLDYDLPDLIAVLPMPILVCNLLDGTGRSLSGKTIETLNNILGRAVYSSFSDDKAILKAVEALFLGKKVAQ